MELVNGYADLMAFRYWTLDRQLAAYRQAVNALKSAMAIGCVAALHVSNNLWIELANW